MPSGKEHSKNLQSLEELAIAAATGEFIAVKGELEVHMFFQLGRMAWGTNSVKRYAFSSHLFQHCDVDKEAFTDLIETCRQEKQHLGETLVAWGLATQNQVREALASQLVETLLCLVEFDSAQTLFLPRSSFADYDAGLTFPVDEIISRAGFLGGGPRERAVSPNHRPLEPAQSRQAESIYSDFKKNVPDANWMELLAEGETSATPKSHELRVATVLAPIFFARSADFVAIRSQHSAILGAAMPDKGETLWTGLGEGATIGNALAALSPVLSANVGHSRLHDHEATAGWETSGHDEEVPADVRAGFEKTDEVLAVFALDDSGKLRWAAARSRLPISEVVEDARAWTAVLDMPLIGEVLSEGRAPGNSITSYANRSLVVASPALWVFGCNTREGSRSGLWLCMSRSATQGLGWALLSSLARIASTKSES